MSDLTPAAQAHLATHHGVVTTAALRAFEVGRTTTDRLVACGVLSHPCKGVYVSTSAPSSLEQRCAIVSAAHPHGFITGPTAGMLQGLRRMPASAALHLSVRHGIHLPPASGVRLRQTTKLARSDREQRADGIAVASSARLAFDLAADLRPIDHLSVVHQLLRLGLVTTDELVAIGLRLCHPGRRGSTTFELNIGRLDAAPGDSHPEVVLAGLLRDRGVPVEPQVRVVGADARPAHLDLAVPAVRWGVELDIHPEHRSLDGHDHDVRRYCSLHLVDWQVEPVSELDMERPARVADELAGLYRRRCRQLALDPSAS